MFFKFQVVLVITRFGKKKIKHQLFGLMCKGDGLWSFAGSLWSFAGILWLFGGSL